MDYIRVGKNPIFDISTIGLDYSKMDYTTFILWD